MADFSFTWKCGTCGTRQREYVVDGLPRLSVVCECCNAVSAYEDLPTITQVDWDLALRLEKGA